MVGRIIACLETIAGSLSAGKPDSFPVSRYECPNIPEDRLREVADGCNFLESESHATVETAIVLEGRCVVELDGGLYMLRENQICVIDGQAEHKTGWFKSDAGGLMLLWLTMTGSFVRLHTTFYNPEDRNIVFGADDTEIYDAYAFLIDEVVRELKRRTEGYKTAVSEYMAALLRLISRRLPFADAEGAATWSRKVVLEAQSYIHEHLDSKLSLKELANCVALSPNYLSILYKHATGRTINGYVQEIRTEQAKKWLRTTDMPLSQIASRLGYYDQYHFSRMFKEHVGQSPRAYRNAKPM